MTREEFSQQESASKHKAAVKKALKEGKHVPDEVLKDYPELTKGGDPRRPAPGGDKPAGDEPPPAGESPSAAAPGHAGHPDPLHPSNLESWIGKVAPGAEKSPDLARIHQNLKSLKESYALHAQAATSGDRKMTNAANDAIAFLSDNLRHDPAFRELTGQGGDEGDEENGGTTPPGGSPAAPKPTSPKRSPVVTREKPEIVKLGVQKQLHLAGLPVTPEHVAMLHQAIENGDIANRQQLGRVAATAGKIHQARGSGSVPAEAVQEAIRRKGNRSALPTSTDLINEASEKHGVSPSDLTEAVGWLHGEKSKAYAEREGAKASIRQQMGLTAGDIQRFENAGLDYSADHPKLRGFDAKAREMASAHPELGLGGGYDSGSNYDDSDYAQALWDILREGHKPAPSHRDPELIEEADQMLAGGKSQLTPEQEKEPAGGDDSDDDDAGGGYSFCPHCGADIVSRERSKDGNSHCENGHVFPHAASAKEKNPPLAKGMLFQRATGQDGES
jgi:hypothetical protein